MEKKPYHHLSDGTFRNPEGSPERNTNFKWSFKIFNKEKKKLDMSVPKDHVVSKEKVLSNLEKFVSINGAKHYDLNNNKEKITLFKSKHNLIFKKYINVNEQKIRVFEPDFPIFWHVLT